MRRTTVWNSLRKATIQTVTIERSHDLILPRQSFILPNHIVFREKCCMVGSGNIRSHVKINMRAIKQRPPTGYDKEPSAGYFTYDMGAYPENIKMKHRQCTSQYAAGVLLFCGIISDEHNRCSGPSLRASDSPRLQERAALLPPS